MNSMNGKIAVAMSGGVDSSVAAALLKKQGNDVVGLSLQLWNYNAETDDRFGTCCSLDDLADARRVAHKFDIPFYILNMEKEFREEVVDRFVGEYLNGRTPIPCTLCNQKLKFDHLLQKCHSLGIEKVATGHYATIVDLGENRLGVGRGRDQNKDQSYFLWGLTQEQLSRLSFPLGNMDKPEVRQLARELGLTVAEKSESFEICFIPNNNYRDFIASQTGGKGLEEGTVVDDEGHVLGKHQGYSAYTIGQRKGMNLPGLTEPYFVTAINPKTNTLTAGPKQKLERTECLVGQVNWYREPTEPIRANVQIRYRHSGAPSKLTPLDGQQARVEFEEPQSAITPGQAAVFYVDDCIVGGGWIE